jgi:soluble lytic murein transglycosylase
MLVVTDPRRLAIALGAAALLVGTGFAVPMLVFDKRPAIDSVTTGSVAAPVPARAAGPAAPVAAAPMLEIEPIVDASLIHTPLTPDNLLMLQAPQVQSAAAVDAIEAAAPRIKAKGSAAFIAALDVLDDGDPARAYELAKSLDDDAERRAVQWAAIRFGDGKVDYEAVIRFSADAPDFARSDMFRTRLEQALMRADAAGPEIIRLLGGSMPNMVEAQMSLALAYVEDGQKERAARIARTIWVDNFLTRAQENLIHKRLGELLTKRDHWDRAVNLMMHDRASGVERLMPFMTDAQKSLAVARNAVSRNAKDAKKLLDAVDPSMKSHPVLVYSRAQRARQFELWDDAVAWLNKAEGELPAAAEWWYERRTLTRQLLALGKYELAFKASEGYRTGPEGRLVEAHFHAGWIALTYLDDAKAAVAHFETMAQHSTLPDSVTQANYWLGRARRAVGDDAGATEAFAKAAVFGTVYYGQLARAELGETLTLRDLPEPADIAAAFEARDIVRAVRLLAESGRESMAATLLRTFTPDLEDGGELLLAAQIAEGMGAHDLAISIAETAERKGFPLDHISFPDDGVPTTMVAEIDHAAIFAVARQESRFRIDAVSSAGARGLMQLMPATARETAQKVGVEYSMSRLTSDPTYNALLGSTYLKAQLEAFEGSLLLAAAAYNAGAGNARKWVRAYGDPRSEEVDPVVWVELIPFQETRKYVQRVLGNYLVYRARLGHDELSMRDALRRIPG